MMGASPVIQTPKLGILQRDVFPITSTRIRYPRQLCFYQSESVKSGIDGSLNLGTVPQSLYIAEKEEAKAVLAPNSKRLTDAMARVSEIGSDGQPHPLILYLLDLGMDIDQIKLMTRRQPHFVFYSLEEKIKPVVEFLLDLGVNRSDIPTILSRGPWLCASSPSENLRPTMTYLENLGVDKKKWAKVILKCPSLLTCSRKKLNLTLDYLHELGLTAENVGKALTRFPNIVGLSVEGNLRPTVEYFRSMGVDVASLVHRAPGVFGLSVDRNLKPITEFFLEVGFSMEEIATMVSKKADLYSYSLLKNIIPKWEFFRTTDYPTSELVNFPFYFGYSLEKRIKPRYARMSECGLKLCWNEALSLAEPEFEKVLKRRKKKLDERSTRFPPISAEENQRPAAEYFRSMGVDVAMLVHQAPHVLSLSIEENLKPITKFFLEKGYSMEEVRTIVSKKGDLYTSSLVKNIIPKWEFFLTMDYPMADIVKFPQYFGYSLEGRIKPRYAQLRESEVKMSLSQFLTLAQPKLEKLLQKRTRKKLDDLGSNMKELMLTIP